MLVTDSIAALGADVPWSWRWRWVLWEFVAALYEQIYHPNPLTHSSIQVTEVQTLKLPGKHSSRLAACLCQQPAMIASNNLTQIFVCNAGSSWAVVGLALLIAPSSTMAQTSNSKWC